MPKVKAVWRYKKNGRNYIEVIKEEEQEISKKIPKDRPVIIWK